MKRILWTLILILSSTIVGSAQTTVYFPQVADGMQPGGIVWTTAIAVANPAALGTSPASGSIAFTADDGSAFNLAFNDELGNPVGSGNSVTFQITGGQTRYFISTSTENLKVGFGTLTSNVAVSAGGVFIETQVFPNGSNTSIAEAGVPAVTPQSQLANAVVEDSGTDTGVAIANPGSSAASITFTLLTTNGVATYPAVTTTLGAHSHTALFVSALFPGVAGKTFYGSMRTTSSTPLVITALTFKPSGQFATLPVFTLGALINPALKWFEATHLAPFTSLASIFENLLMRLG